ncbi:MAG: rRNA maturation RNase YbeY [Anaerolineae bacterium]
MIDFEIEVQIETPLSGPEDVLVNLLAMAVTTTLRQEQTAVPAALTILLTDDAAIQRLNQTYRGQNRPTDVLSFAGGDPMPGMTGVAAYLGDVVISVPTAQAQADHAGHSLDAELQLLAVHGTLHLLGFDHGDESEKTEMWAAQTAVMTLLGLLHVTPTEA